MFRYGIQNNNYGIIEKKKTLHSREATDDANYTSQCFWNFGKLIISILCFAKNN